MLTIRAKFKDTEWRWLTRGGELVTFDNLPDASRVMDEILEGEGFLGDFFEIEQYECVAVEYYTLSRVGTRYPKK